MRNKAVKIAIISLLTVAALFGTARVVFGSGSTDIPVAYVISDGTDCYFIDYSNLLRSYIVYMDNPEADSAKLAKFYFDTLGSDVTNRFKAYVSGITGKFVNFRELISKYMETEDVDSTYMWFNDVGATPAFSAITKVWVLDSNCSISGRYYVNTNGYIIRRSTYELDMSLPDEIAMNAPTEFMLSVTSNDLGCDTLSGSLICDITGGNCTLEAENGGGWETVTDGVLASAINITPDWTATVNLRITAHTTGACSLKFQLKTDGGDVLAEKTKSITITGAMQLSSSVPTFRVGTPVQFSLTTIANGDVGRMAQAHFTIPAGAAVEYLDSGSGNWLPLPEVYGPSTGFAVADGTMTLRAEFSEAGTKTITVSYVEVGSGIVLTSKDIEITVEQPMSVSAGLPSFFAGEPETFTLTTAVHDDAGKPVRIYFTVPSDVTLEYQDEATGDWLLLTGGYGPAAGFAATDATYTFRATLSGIGMKQIEVQFIEVDTNTVLADARFIATASYRVQPSITIPGLASLTLPSGETEVNVDIGNPPNNTCNMVISLVLEDGTVLFTSGILAPGESVGNVTLSSPLAPGAYSAAVCFEAYDPDDNSALNTAEVNIILFIE